MEIEPKRYPSVEAMIRDQHGVEAPEVLLGMEKLRSKSLKALATTLARRLIRKGDVSYVLEAYKQAGLIPAPPLVEREGTGEDS